MKYIITESQFNIFFRRRIPRIDNLIDESFTQLFRMYKCKENNLLFDPFWRMVVDDVIERALGFINREVSRWADEKFDYESMLEMYLKTKEHHYKIEYNKRCM